MALRIRRNGFVLCAALSEPKEGDLYIDDRVHGILCDRGAITTKPMPFHKINGGKWRIVKKLKL